TYLVALSLFFGSAGAPWSLAGKGNHDRRLIIAHSFAPVLGLSSTLDCTGERIEQRLLDRSSQPAISALVLLDPPHGRRLADWLFEGASSQDNRRRALPIRAPPLPHGGRHSPSC